MFEDNDDDAINPEQMPIVKKGQEIFELTHKISELIPEDDEMLMSVKEFMLADAGLLSAKVVGAEAAELYDLKMENAAIIRKAGRDMILHCRELEMFDFKETQYLDLIREAIEEYRVLFVEWVKTFDPWNYVIDRWGLFNPPGVDADDHNPDDDIPYDPDDDMPY